MYPTRKVPQVGAELENPSSGSCFRIHHLGDPEPMNQCAVSRLAFRMAEDRTASAFLPPQYQLQTQVPRTPPQGFLFSKWSGPKSLYNGYEPLGVQTRGLWSLGTLISQPPSRGCFYEPLLLSSHSNRYCTSLGDTSAVKL